MLSSETCVSLLLLLLFFVPFGCPHRERAQSSNKHRDRTNDSNIYKHDRFGCTTMTTFYFAFEKCWPLAKHREREREENVLIEHKNNRKSEHERAQFECVFLCSSSVSLFRFRVSRCRFDPFFFLNSFRRSMQQARNPRSKMI